MDYQAVSQIVVRAELVMDSVLHIGSGDHLNYMGIQSLFRDGDGRPVIPGSSIAGVFIDRLLQQIKNDPALISLHRKITGKGLPANSDDSEASVYYFPTLHLLEGNGLTPEALSLTRDMVCLQEKTRTAVDGGKFAFEVLDPGLRFELLVIVECEAGRLSNSEKEESLWLLTEIFKEWSMEGNAFIGSNSARGMGWFHLENPVVAFIDSPESLRSYLDSLDESAWIEDREAQGITRRLDSLEFASHHGAFNPIQRKNWDCRLSIREEKDQFGLWPAIVRSNKSWNTNESDFEFVTTRHWTLKDGRWSSSLIPVIPGSSLRGAARSFLCRLAGGGEVSWTVEDVNRLFGPKALRDLAKSRVKFRDGYFAEDFEGRKAHYTGVLERIALDEYTRSVYGSGKFNYSPLFKGCFDARIVVENPTTLEEIMIESLFLWGGEDFPWIGIGAHGSPMQWSRGDG